MTGADRYGKRIDAGRRTGRFRTPFLAVSGNRTFAVFAAGCTTPYEGRYDFYEGWRKPAIVRRGALRVRCGAAGYGITIAADADDTSVGILGLIPMLLSTRVGAETRRPLAIYEWSELRAEARRVRAEAALQGA